MIGLVALCVLVLANCFAIFVVRAAVARWFGLSGASIRILSEGRISFENARTGARPAIAIACIAVPYVVSALFFSTSFFVGGEVVYGTCADMAPGGPAVSAGLQDGDCFESINGTAVDEWTDIPPLVAPHANEPIEVRVRRAGEPRTFTVTPSLADGVGKLGLIAKGPPIARDIGFFRAIGRGFVAPAEVAGRLADLGWHLVAGDSRARLGNPVSMMMELQRSARMGAGELFLFMGSLGVFLWPAWILVTVVFLPRRKAIAATPPPPEKARGKGSRRAR